MHHYHVYDVTGEMMCVDADTWILAGEVAYFYNEVEGETVSSATVATFNWPNVVCVREESHDDDEEEVPAEPAGWWAGLSN